MTRSAAALALLALLAAGPSAADEPKGPPLPVAPPNSAGQAAERLGLKFTPNAELVITSDEAEGVKADGGRQSVVFSKHVKAHQGDMNLECDWLEAIYPPETAHRPDNISAKGAVVITQGTNQARCMEAHIDNVACTAECRSTGTKATLTRGTDDVEADVIYFDLCKGTVKAVGRVQVRVREKPEDTTPPPAPAPSAAPAKADGG
ncbi:MAG TPA: LptA/OstA family protein [Myxococcota bacterium]|nr:LptA/OstA family protein [Myxococcota bacterium]